MQEIGHAALAIIPSFDGFQGDLERGSSKAMVAAGGSGGRAFGKEAGDNATSEMSSRISDWSKKGAAALGAGIGLAVGYGFREGIDREAIGDRLAASLGLSPKQQQQQGKIAGSLYAKAFGDSYEDASTAVSATVSSIKGLQGNGEIRRATADALNFATAFEVDIARAVQIAGTTINSGLAPDAEAAFDLLTRSSQKVPAALREDLLDAVEEYGGFFRTLGFDGPKAFQLLVKGAEQGIYGIDKTGDALKEFSIRATDGSKATATAFDQINLPMRKIEEDLLAGGDGAQVAFQKVVDGLLDMKDPADRASAAIALFGTPLEDLNVGKIPDFLRSLQTTKGGLDDVKGAADRMGDTLSDNVSTDITKMKRKLENDLVEFISKKGLPALESFSDWVKKDAGPAFRNFKDDVDPVVDVVKDLVGAFSDLPTGGKLAALGGTLAGGLVVKHKLGGIFDRGGIANPMFVVVTNPTGVPGAPVVPGAGGKPGIPGAPVLATGSKLIDKLLRFGLVGGGVAAAGAAADRGVIDENGAPAKVAGPERTAKFLSDAMPDREQSLRDFYLAGEKATTVAEKLGVTTDANVGKFDAFYTATGKAKTRVDKMRESVDLLAQSRIAIDIQLNGYERAMQQIATLQGAANSVPTAGVDNGVTYLQGGGTSASPRAGIVIERMDVHGLSLDDALRDGQRRMQRKGLGGRP